jgi:signal peptidase I
MKPLSLILVSPKDNNKYITSVKIGGFDFVVNGSEENYEYANREAIVKVLPHRYKGDLSVGDTIIVHHNTFRNHYDMTGGLQVSSSYFKGNLYAVEPTEYFLYRKKESTEWIAHDRFCFVKPIKQIKGLIDKGVENEPLIGEMLYPNKYMSSLNVNKGDTVVFAPDSEYLFNIEGQKTYRIYDHQITIKI